jgi:hypothetical protein
VTGATGTFAVGDLDPSPLPVGAERVTFGTPLAVKQLAPAKVVP